MPAQTPRNGTDTPPAGAAPAAGTRPVTGTAARPETGALPTRVPGETLAHAVAESPADETAERPALAGAEQDPAAAVEFATRVLSGWHFVAELSVLGQPMCACGQSWEYCEYRVLARRCGLSVPSHT
jgi:hypothetical protein